MHLLVQSFHVDDAGYSRDETVYKGLDLSKNESDDVTSSATQDTLTSPSAVTSQMRKYDDGVDKSSSKFHRVCVSRDDRLPFTSGSYRRLANCSSSTCAGHVVSLRPGGDESGGSDVTASPPTPHDRVSSSVASCRSLPPGLPLQLRPYPPSLIQSPGVFSPSTRGPPTTDDEHAAAARPTSPQRDRRGFVECRHCRIGFRDRVTYTLHMGYHGFDAPFSCNMCGHQSADRVEFFVHIATAAH